MKVRENFALLIVLLVCCAAPAYANNPPQPDGILSILLIFPIVIVAWRLAGVTRSQKPRWEKVTLPLLLALAVIVSMAGTGLALFPLLLILAYGIWRAVQIITKGQGGKRFVLGAAVIVWVFLAVVDYSASLSYRPRTPALEAAAVYQLRTLVSAEQGFNNPASTQRPLSQSYGTIAELKQARFLDVGVSEPGVYRGYLYGEIVDKTKNQFFFYAIPAFPYKPERKWPRFFPAGSLLWPLFQKEDSQATGERSFAVDETGVIRYLPHRNSQSPVTRQEASHWPILE